VNRPGGLRAPAAIGGLPRVFVRRFVGVRAQPGGHLLLVASAGLLLASAVCGGPERSRAGDSAKPPIGEVERVEAPGSGRDDQSAIAEHRAEPDRPVSDAVSTPAGAYRIEFRHRPGDVRYFQIENEFRDSGGVPPLLSFTTTIKDRRHIIERVVPCSQPSQSAPAGAACVVWECDRYEVRESGMKEESAYDSLRHTFAPPALRNLGTIPGSRCTFAMDAAGRISNLLLVPGPSNGPSGRGVPSKTTERCALTHENVQHLLEDLGAYYLPLRPVRVGEEWTKTYTDSQKTFGVVTTLLRCRLRGVRPVEDRDVATIELSGEVSLQSAAAPAQPAASQPGHPRPVPAVGPTQREFKLERGVCSGTVEFDVTRGELLRLDLRREVALSADIDSKATSQTFGPMKLKSGSLHHLRVSTSRKPPPRPVIVGGPKPPPMPKEDMPTSPNAVLSPIQATSQPASAPARAAPQPRPAGSLPGAAQPLPRHKRPPGYEYKPFPDAATTAVATRPGLEQLPYLPPAKGAKITPPPRAPSLQHLTTIPAQSRLTTSAPKTAD